MSFRKMRLVPEDQYQMGGALEDDVIDPKLPKTNDTEDISDHLPLINTTDTEPRVEPEYDKTIKKRRVERDSEKIVRLIKIALKIAKTNSYDEELRIIGENGNPIQNSNLPLLLKYVMTPEKVIVAENDFIRILYEAGVDPDWISNENVKYKLLNYRKPNKRKRETTPPPLQPNVIKEPERTFAKVKKNFNNKSTVIESKPSTSRVVNPMDVALPEDDDYDLL